MNINNQCTDLCHAIAESQNHEEVLDHTIQVLSLYYIPYFAYLIQPGFGARMILTNYRDRYQDLYEALGFFEKDLVMIHAKIVETLFPWNSLRLIHENAKGNYHYNEVFWHAQRYGLREGVTIPIHGNVIQVGAFSMAIDDREGEMQKILTSHKPALIMIARAVHKRTQEIEWRKLN